MERISAIYWLNNLIGKHSDYYDEALEMGIKALGITRCKDCKYMTTHYDTDGNAPYWTCSVWDSRTDYNGFCHYAERRIDEDD